MQRIFLSAAIIFIFLSASSAGTFSELESAFRSDNIKAVVNIPERIIRFYSVQEVNDYAEPIMTYRVAVGQKKYPTPIFQGKIVSRRAKPSWFVPKQEWAGEFAGKVIPFNDPENPFRARNENGRVEGYFLSLGTEGVGLHSTRESRSIGKLASHGCIRMRLEDVRFLFRNLKDETPVKVDYKLYRIEKSDTGLIVHAFEDVYDRFSIEDRKQHLISIFEEHSIPIAILMPEEFEQLMAGKSVKIDNVVIPSSQDIVRTNINNSVLDRTVNMWGASEILARAVCMMRR